MTPSANAPRPSRDRTLAASAESAASADSTADTTVDTTADTTADTTVDTTVDTTADSTVHSPPWPRPRLPPHPQRRIPTIAREEEEVACSNPTIAREEEEVACSNPTIAREEEEVACSDHRDDTSHCSARSRDGPSFGEWGGGRVGVGGVDGGYGARDQSCVLGGRVRGRAGATRLTFALNQANLLSMESTQQPVRSIRRWPSQWVVRSCVTRRSGC